MKYTKPEWIMHQDGTRNENAKRLSIFSVHVHPDGSRIATGGLDAKVRIWSTKPILSPAAEKANKPPKSLCTLTMHTGPVLTVRWAHSGRWLASGSDDEIVMIWDLDPTGSGKIWGSNEVNVEGWKPLRRLPGHESDVTDLAWAPEDRYLASTGLDSKVIIWCGYTLERLAKLDMHQGFVKGVCWDPVGEFLATQSDDRTVRIWRTTDWGLEATVSRPFEHSPGSTFFRRLSWSPDGAHITASNATNNNGYVFTAAVITRGTWTSEISLVGHENTVEVAAYNPRIFLRDPSQPCTTANICSVVALGADDQALSVWQTKSARPLVVANNAFDRNIMDLSWSEDGLTLYAVSSDGTLACLAFDAVELEGRASKEAQKQYLSKFGFVPPPLPPGYTHALETANKNNSLVNGVSGAQKSRAATSPAGEPQHNGFGYGSAPSGEHITTLVARRAPRDRNGRRIHLANVPSSSLSAPPPMNRQSELNTHTQPPAQHTSSVTYNGKRDIFSDSGADMHMELDGFDGFHGSSNMDMAVPINALDTRGRRGRGSEASTPVTVSGTGNSLFTDDGGKAPKARTLGGDRIRGSDSADRVVREIRREAGGSSALALEVSGNARNIGLPNDIVPAASLKTLLEVRIEETGEYVEVRNSETRGEHSEITYFNAKEKSVQWLDYLAAPALAICATKKFCAVALDDGSINVYSPTGRRLLPTLAIGSSVAFLEADKCFLMAITTLAEVFVWNIKTQSAVHPPTSLRSLLTQQTDPSPSNPNGGLPHITSACVRPNGAPLVHLSTGVALSYDAALLSWVRVGESFWASGSTFWKGRQRSAAASSGSGPSGVVTNIEARVAERIPDTVDGPTSQQQPWWNTALSLDHLEARMHAARVLGSGSEYRQALLLYSKALADEGFRGKAEEMLRELYGPVFWRPGNKSDEAWCPTVVGLSKRELIKDVLVIFARSKTLAKLAQDYQDLLRKASLVNDD